jgi:energy-converting hydrogenase Eha subunit B
MSDLITLHPNLMIRLYIVAPDARMAKVMNELVRRFGDQLKPGFLSGIAECAPDVEEGYRSA